MTSDGGLYEVFVYLSTSPLFGLTVTLVVFQLAGVAYRRSGQVAMLNPVLVSIVVIALLLAVTGVEYRTYFDGAQFIHFLLGPATVALAVPLHRERAQIRRAARPLLLALLVGSLIAVASAVGLAALLGASSETVISLAPKSATAPVAMSVSERLGGIPSLTAAFAILTGITGAVAGPALLKLLGVRDPRARGFGLGVASHGIGTARAMQEGERAGAFSSLGFALNAIATSILVPVLFVLMPGL